MEILAESLHWSGNLIEAGFWIALGVGFGVFGMTRSGAVRGRCAIAAVALVAFGFSDVVEMRTGAWYRPWWLLGWKGVCVVALALLLWDYFRGQRRQ